MNVRTAAAMAPAQGHHNASFLRVPDHGLALERSKDDYDDDGTKRNPHNNNRNRAAAAAAADDDVPVLLRIIDDEYSHSFVDDDEEEYYRNNSGGDPFGSHQAFRPDEARIPLRKKNMEFFNSSRSDEATTVTVVDMSKLVPADNAYGSDNNATNNNKESAAAQSSSSSSTIAAAAPPKSILSRLRGGGPAGPEDDSMIKKKASIRCRSSRGITFSAADDNVNNKDEVDPERAHIQPPHALNNRSTTGGKNKKKNGSSSRSFFSQPMPSTVAKLSVEVNRAAAAAAAAKASRSGPIQSRSRRNVVQDSDDDDAAAAAAAAANKGKYAMFETKSKKQFSTLLSTTKKVEDERCRGEAAESRQGSQKTGKAMPAGRYFDALKGPELETLKDCEEPLLPLDQKWPFLLRFPIGCFGICLGLGSQTILWKALSTAISLRFLRIPLSVNLALWYLAASALAAVSLVYSLKCFFYLEAVRREYYHPVRVNFFFAPWIACMFLALGVPPRIAISIHPALWCSFTAPILILELKIYGQWLSGGARRLSRVANPSTHLSLVGNFISSLLASAVGWKEPAIFFWAVGAAHYLVVFVTLYQRLPTCEVLTKELHPVFFLFVAAPSAASVAWKSINDGHFDYVSRVPYFLALFLYSSLVVRLNFFYGFKFSLTWWAYTFPMTAAAIATIHYSLEVRHPVTQTMAVLLSLISSAVVLSLFVTTVVHAVTGRLFQNDLAIAIATKRRKRKQKGLLWKADGEESRERQRGGNVEEEAFTKEEQEGEV